MLGPDFLGANGVLKGGGNIAAIHLANAVGVNVFLGFISAVAFATILAVVAGLTLPGASAMSHDLYATVIKKGDAGSAAELRVSKITTLALGALAVVLGIVFEKQNIAFMVPLAFAIAASASFPVLFMSVLWKCCTTRGAVIGGFLAQQVRSETDIGAHGASGPAAVGRIPTRRTVQKERSPWPRGARPWACRRAAGRARLTGS